VSPINNVAQTEVDVNVKLTGKIRFHRITTSSPIPIPSTLATWVFVLLERDGARWHV
jgi:hypothetical protein